MAMIYTVNLELWRKCGCAAKDAILVQMRCLPISKFPEPLYMILIFLNPSLGHMMIVIVNALTWPCIFLCSLLMVVREEYNKFLIKKIKDSGRSRVYVGPTFALFFSKLVAIKNPSGKIVLGVV